MSATFNSFNDLFLVLYVFEVDVINVCCVELLFTDGPLFKHDTNNTTG